MPNPNTPETADDVAARERAAWALQQQEAFSAELKDRMARRLGHALLDLDAANLNVEFSTRAAANGEAALSQVHGEVAKLKDEIAALKSLDRGERTEESLNAADG